jgi:AcrR family transcriptional regulator
MEEIKADAGGPRRRPAEGGYARGDEKRLRIIETALRVFGEHGYESASTRKIAQDAGVNPPALQYYFESKEGLYLACADYIVDHVLQALEGAFAAADTIKLDDPPEKAIDALCGIMDALADWLLGSTQMQGWSRFIARAQGERNDPASNLAKQRISIGIHTRCAYLVGIASGRNPDDIQTKLQSVAILSQLTGFHLGRQNALTALGWTEFHREGLIMLKALLRQQTHAILRRD